MKKLSITVLIVLILPFMIAAGGQQDVPVTEDTVPQLRVVSLAPNITEAVFALGKGGCLVGRTDYCDYPPEALSVASVGSIMQPSTETIIELAPDFIFASTHAPKDAADVLTDAGLEVKYYYGPESFEGVYDVIASVGADLGVSEAADAMINDIRRRYEEVKAEASGSTDRPSVYYVVGFGEGGDWTAGGDTFIGKMIDIAGGDNIAKDISGWSFSLEKIVEADPDIIIVNSILKDDFVSAPIYSELSAAKAGNVIGVDENIIARQGPRLIEGLEFLNDVFSK